MQETSLHATLVRVHGRGVLIRGKPGSGKSRLALELIHHGHALVADDLVLTWPGETGLQGRAASAHKGFLALRGAGILNVAQTFGDAHWHSEPQPIDWIVDLGGCAVQPTPEHDVVSLNGVSLPRLCLQPNSRDATLVALCCRLGSDMLQQWKSDDVDQ